MQHMISIDRIRTEEITRVEETLSPEFLAVAEEDLSFTSPVSLKLDLTLSSDFLLVTGRVETTALCRCKICNEFFPLQLSVQVGWTSEEPLSNEFDLFPLLREQILLEIPSFVECNRGNCPEREALQNYFSKQKAALSPFSNL